MQASQNNFLKTLESSIIDRATNEYSLYSNRNWIDKCLQIYAVSNIYRGIILVGAPCTGKTTTLNILIESLSEISRASSASRSNFVFKQQNQISASHKLRRYLVLKFLNY